MTARPVTTLRRTSHRPRLAAAAVLALGAWALAGCSADADASADPASGDAVTLTDAWVKAADSGMSGAFGVLENTGDTDITLVSVASPASTMLELHETVQDDAGAMVMQRKDGGFTIAAGETLVLEPGGNHIMLMDLVEPIAAGDDVQLTLTFSDDSTLEVTAPAKDYSGANETYVEGDNMDMDE